MKMLRFAGCAVVVTLLAAQYHMNQRLAYRSVIAVMDTLRLILAQGDSVEIGGFGSF